MIPPHLTKCPISLLLYLGPVILPLLLHPNVGRRLCSALGQWDMVTLQHHGRRLRKGRISDVKRDNDKGKKDEAKIVQTREPELTNSTKLGSGRIGGHLDTRKTYGLWSRLHTSLPPWHLKSAGDIRVIGNIHDQHRSI